MLLTIETTYRPATDLGYLLHKNPAALPDLVRPSKWLSDGCQNERGMLSLEHEIGDRDSRRGRGRCRFPRTNALRRTEPTGVEASVT